MLFVLIFFGVGAVLLVVAISAWNEQRQRAEMQKRCYRPQPKRSAQQRSSYSAAKNEQDIAREKMARICQNISSEMRRLGLGDWPYWIHGEPDQMTREKRAYNSRVMKIISADSDRKVYEVMGEQGTVYDISNGVCSCPDFRTRGKPCKHIYFVEMELGHGSDEQ